MFKKKEKEKSPKGLSSFFKKKPKERRESSFWFYFVVFLIILFALNVALLLPPQLSSVFFEIEIFILATLYHPVSLALWIWLVLFSIALLTGYYFVPVLTIPSTGEWYIIRDSWIEGDIRFFKTLSGKILGIHRELIDKIHRHWFVFGPVGRIVFENYILYQTEELEVTAGIMAQRLAEQLATENAVLREMLKRYEPYLSIEDVERLNAIRTAGVREE